MDNNQPTQTPPQETPAQTPALPPVPQETAQQPVPQSAEAPQPQVVQTPTAPALPKQPEAPTPGQVAGKPPQLSLHRLFLIILIALVVIFGAAYIGTFYLLNQQLSKLSHSGQPATVKPTVTSIPTQIPPTEIPISETVIPTTSDQTQVACTQEAKLCPDGKNYVSRVGPSCEFAACPQ